MKLERTKIVDAALSLLDEVGLDQLSLRRLAVELGVQAPALYWHFANKQQLLDEMADALSRQIPFPPLADGQRWEDWLGERMRAQRRLLTARRDAARLFVGTRPGPRTLPILEEAVETLHRAGFPPAEALRGLLTLGDYVTGFVLEEQAAAARGEATDLDAATRLLADHAVLLAAFVDSGPPHDDEAFERGLDLILTGMRTRLG